MVLTRALTSTPTYAASSSSSCTNPISTSNVGSLGLTCTFELIPDCPASQAAGYTDDQRAQAMSWYAPAVDDDAGVFYYTAWYGQLLGVHLSSILVCRNLCDGSLVYAVNCGDYNLDTAPNFIGDTTVVARSRIVIFGDTLLLSQGCMSNIGPQLYCVNKCTGALNWARAYYPPDGCPQVTTKGDYSQYVGQVNRMANVTPVTAVVPINGVSHRYIFMGVSSFQNSVNANALVTGWPLYDCQGGVWCIEDLGTSSSLIWNSFTCAPVLKIGDTLIKGGNPIYDPFKPSQSTVVIDSITNETNLFVLPAFLDDLPAPATPNTCPVVGSFILTADTVISTAMFQPLWSLSGVTIYQDTDRVNPVTLSELVTQWQAEQAAGTYLQHMIWAFVSPAVITQAQSQPANLNILYFKALPSGHTLDQVYDANAINFWANSTWGNCFTILPEFNIILASTGQCHDMPRSDSLYYADPTRNFRTLRTTMIDTLVQYEAGEATLAQVNTAKATFANRMRSLAVDVSDRSPRDRMSYSDAVMAFYIKPFTNSSNQVVPAGTLAFAVRTIPWDAWTFLTTDQTTVLPLQTIDGDCDAGVFKFTNKNKTTLVVSGKHGLHSVIDISNFNRNVKFNHSNLAAVGVSYTAAKISGACSSGGGSNYEACASGSSFVHFQVNFSLNNGCTSSDGVFEFSVTQTGTILPVYDSFVQAVSSVDGSILWETAIDNLGASQAVAENGLVYVVDGSGNLYVLDASNGAIVWKADGMKLGMNGGIVAPGISEQGYLVYANNYSPFGVGGAVGPNGAIFELRSDLALSPSSKINQILKNQTFTSWDMAPKTAPGLYEFPLNTEVITHTWSTSGSSNSANSLRLSAIHATLGGGVDTLLLSVKSYNPSKKVITFQPLPPAGTRQIIYSDVTMINTQKYVVHYSAIDDGIRVNYTAWLDLND